MKKSIRNSLIISAILILCGAVITFVALDMVSFNFSELATNKLINKSEIITKPFSNINVNISNEDLKIAQSVDDKCRIEYICPENLEYTLSVSDGTLTITEKDNRKWYDYIGISINETEMTLYLPENEYKNFDIETNTGDVSLKDIKPESLSIITDTGDILIDDFVSKGKVIIKSNTGDVEILKSDAGSFEIETDTGDVSGALLTNKFFYIETDTGNVDIPKEYSGGECRIKTDTGDICIKIEK